jgi:HTH-type transcriptional regulator, sugar sensing transcriptional regulator
MESEKLLEKILLRLGLSSYEIRAYSSLVLEGQLKATEISKNTNIPQSKIYTVLGLLEMKGMIESCPGFPKEYKAVSPSVATKRLLAMKEQKIKELKEDIGTSISKITPALKRSYLEEEKIWTVMGKESFPIKAAELLKKSKESLILCTLHFTLTPDIESAFKDAVKRGIDCRVIGYIDESTVKNAYKYMKMGFKVRHLNHGFIRFAVLDKRFVIFRLGHPEKGDYSSVWAENSSLANIFTEVFDSIWKEAAKPETIIKKYMRDF